ncbi:hypothetical protein [Microbacterium hydrocarbonoxydans]|uniref:hypothetical protein n=1 Tax=Microbacterium hydrocarbonoxydans TaxID=273678 RepID=UPI0007BBD46F|nr:hypothetical protein [Microbacterium hydrocarbonoxydans]GAT73222.1 hypothetical protein MHM582_1707 [Microbacterium sp. HM58-2]
MSDPRAIPDEERPFIPEELVPRQESEDPMRADGSEAITDAASAESGESADDTSDEDDDSIDVEDLP